MIENQRHLFAIPRDVAYLNCGYMSPLARPVVDAVAEGARLKTEPWKYRAADFFTIPEATRSALAAVVETSPDNLALVPSASYGLATAARNLPVRKGQAIVLLEDQFPSNVYVWRDLAAEAGARVVHARREGRGAWTEAVLDAIGPDTAIVAVPYCHWADGGLLDLVRIGAAARRHGAALVLDLTQSLGAMPFDLDAVDPDFVAVACYKWLMSPYGTGALYAAPRHHGGRAIEQSWLSRAGAEDFARLVEYRDDFQPGARRFDMGEKSNPPLLLGVSEALRLVIGWGVAAIAETLGGYTRALGARLAELGLTALPDEMRAPHFLSVTFAGGVPEGLLASLAQAGVHVSVRGTSLRITPHLYNDDEDADRLVAALRAAL